MKKLLALILVNLLISGCMSSPVPMPTTTIISDTTKTPIPALTSTIIPTNTPEIITNTCLENKTEIPLNDVNGTVVLNGAYLVYDKSTNQYYALNPDTAYLWNLKNNSKIELFHQKGEELTTFFVSPNHKWLVYQAGNFDGSGQRITVVDMNGKLIRNVVDRRNWFSPFGWLDDQHLAIWMLSDVKYGPPSPTLIFNPFTWDSKLIMPDYPNISVWQSNGWPETQTIYDPTLNFVVYVTMPDATGRGDIVLWDLNQKRELIRLKHLSVLGNNNAPLWSSDGSEFIIDAKLENRPTFELYSVNRNGDIQQLTHFENLITQKTIKNVDLWNYSWSNDSHYIAFWYQIDEQKTYQLALLDTSTGQTRDLCITNQDSNIIKAPIWSPDSTQFLISESASQGTSTEDYLVMLVDVKYNYVVEIAKDVFPEGWLTTLP